MNSNEAYQGIIVMTSPKGVEMEPCPAYGVVLMQRQQLKQL